MTTAKPEERWEVSQTLAELEATATGRSSASRGGGKWLVRSGAVLVAIALAVAASAWWPGDPGAGQALTLKTQPVQRGQLLATITEDGLLESSDNLDLKCEVAGGTTILWIVEDGKHVEKDAVLVRLDSAKLEEQVSQQRIVYEKARATHIQAEQEFAAAKIAVQEYLEGTYRQELQTLATKVTVARENLRSAQNGLEHTEQMFRKGYVTPLQLETQQFAVARAKLDLDSANTAKDVLERFTKPKTLTTLEAKRDTTETRMRSEHASLALEESRLKRLERYIAKCTIRAPKPGMAIYASERGHHHGPQPAEIKEGAAVRDQQTILRLPDLTRMQVRVTVHESRVNHVHPGMPVRIQVQEREFPGTVLSVAGQPEPSSLFSASVKEFAALVKINGESTGLKPGMTAAATMLLENLDDVLTIPLTAVCEPDGETYCYVRNGSQYDRRPVTLGLRDETRIEVQAGLSEGESVVVEPAPLLAALPATHPPAND